MSNNPKLVKINPLYGQSSILMEVTEVDEDASKQTWQKNSTDMLDKIKPFCESVTNFLK